MTRLCECGCGLPAPIAPRTNRTKGWVKGEPLRYIRFHGRQQHPPDRFCGACGALLKRKRYGLHLETLRRFTERIYCDEACMGKGFLSATASPSALRKRALPFRGDACEVCGSMKNVGAHHVDGDLAHNTAENIQTLCGSCHMTLHNLARRDGRAVPGRAETAT